MGFVGDHDAGAGGAERAQRIHAEGNGVVVQDKYADIGGSHESIFRAASPNAQSADIDVEVGRIFDEQDAVCDHFTCVLILSNHFR